MTAPHILALALKLPEFEGSIGWMYRDTVGKVTVADGLMLPDVSSAIALPFQFAGAIAEPGDIRADYLRVAQMAPGHVAGFYHCATSPTLSRDAMENLAIAKLTEFDAGLRKMLPSFDGYPECAKAALLDIAYNCGIAGFARFPHMIAAVEAGHWTLAAQESHRPQVNADRNAWTAAQLQLAA
jgi:GH24 family phage-related lysozyme (muramidase)